MQPITLLRRLLSRGCHLCASINPGMGSGAQALWSVVIGVNGIIFPMPEWRRTAVSRATVWMQDGSAVILEKLAR